MEESTANTKLTWDRKGINFLIQLLKGHQCLWNPKDIGYRNLAKRKTCLRAICHALRQTGRHHSILDIKKKIRSLRSMFGREQRRVEASVRSGVATDQIYTPNWEYYKALSFIASPPDTNCESQPNTNGTADIAEDVVEVTVDEVPGESFEVVCSGSSSIDDGNRSISTNFSSISQPTEKRKRERSDVEDIVNAITGLYHPDPKREQSQDLMSLSVRGLLQFIGAQLMEMPVKSRNKLQRKLLAYFLEETEKLEEAEAKYGSNSIIEIPTEEQTNSNIRGFQLSRFQFKQLG